MKFIKKWLEKRAIRKLIKISKLSPKVRHQQNKLQLIVFVNSLMPEEEIAKHALESVTGWYFKNSFKPLIVRWFQQTFNREDNLIIYKVDNEQIQNIINIPKDKVITTGGDIPVSICLGLLYENENPFTFERI
jgi:hypothetical protein